MIWVTAGTDVYGAVRKVGTTPIVTKFAMLQFLPLFPIESYYLSRTGTQTRTGVPLIFGQSSQSISGLRLASVDRLSACVAYLRALGASITLFAFIGLMLAIVTSFSGPRNERDPVQRYLLPASLIVLGGGLLIALPTYYFTYVVPVRDKLIRETCGELLGIDADPACVDADTARELLRMTHDAMARSGITEPAKLFRNLVQANPDQIRLLLLLARVQIATSGRRDKLEPMTDSLLLALTDS